MPELSKRKAGPSEGAPGAGQAPPLVVECVDFHHLRKPPMTIELHMHPYYQLDVYPEGSIEILLEGRAPVFARPWSCLLIPPMTGHGYLVERRAMQISIKFHIHPRYWLKFGSLGELVDIPPWHGELLSGAFEAFQAKGSSVSRRHVDSAIEVCLASWLKAQDARRSAPPGHEYWGHRMRLALEMIAESPSRHWPVASLAKSCGLSPDLFCRRFQEAVGKPPRRFVVELRMRTAANRLLHDGVAIKEAAREAGYSTVHSFSRAFTSVFGSGPAAYLKSLPPNL